MAEPEEDFSSLPLPQRITHKIWKVRLAAYEELTKKFQTADPTNDSEFRPYEQFLKNIATDANAVAQETGLTTLLAFVENAPNPTKSRSSVVPAVVEKGFGSARPGTKKKAVELIILYIEVDTPDPVLEDVISGLNAKQPKLVATTVFALKEIIRLYGAKTVNPKPILKILPKIFNHTDKNVRVEGTNLVVELYKWLGQAINPHLQELKPIQVKELNEMFEKLPPEKPTQQRLLRSQQAAAAAAAETGGDDEAVSDEEEQEIDIYDSAEPVDILSKMAKDFYEQLGSKKWKDRKEALEGLLEVLKTPRIADNNYSELVTALMKRMSDSNILVVTFAANCTEALAKGLRGAFSKYKQIVVGPITEKLKERKQSVIDTLAATLDAVFMTVTFADLTEDFLAGGKHKNPQVKTETMKWLVRCIKSTKTAPNRTEIKSLNEMLVKASEDSFEPVRSAAFEGLGTLMKVIGEKAMNPFLEGVDDIKKAKIKEYFEKAEVKVKVSNVRPQPPPAEKASEPPRSKPAGKPKPTTATKPKAPAPKKAPAISVPTLASVQKKAPGPAAPPPKKAPSKQEPLKYKFSNEEVEGKFSDLVPESETAELSDKNWKLRLAAIENLYNTLDGMNPDDIEAELVIRFLAKKPGWKESNFQVMTKAFNIIEMQSVKVPSFSKSAASLAIPILVEKLGDIKLKKSSGDCLTSFSEKISLQFVLSQADESFRKAKSPKILADSLAWVRDAIMQFGIAGLQVRELIELLKFSLGNTNAAVRTNAVSVLGALRIFVGPGIRTFVQDLNATQLAVIDAEFEKVADQAPPQVSKVSGELANPGDALEELFPKVDIGSQFTSKMIADCNDEKWKIRKEGLEQVKAIVDASQKIKPNLGDLMPVLKARLADSNKSLQMMALEICGKLATAMGKPFEKHVKMVVGPITAVLTDQKATVRGSAIATLDALANATGLDPLIGSFSTSLSSENPLLRKDLLNWLSERLKDLNDKDKKSFPDLKQMVPSLLSCLADRNGEVRKAAQACLGPIIMSAGYDYVVSKCGDLKGAVKQSIMPMIEAARPAVEAANKGKATQGKKPQQKSLLGPGSKRESSPDEEDEEEEEQPTLPSLPALRRPTGRLPGPPPALASGAPSTIPTSVQSGQVPESASGLPSGLPSTLRSSSSVQSSALPGLTRGLPQSGIGRGLPGPSRIQSSSLPTDSTPTEVPSKVSPPTTFMNKQRALNSERSPEVKMDYIIKKVLSSEAQQSIEGLKEVDKELNGSRENVIGYVDKLINALTLQIHLFYPQIEPQKHTLTRLCKHLVNTLVVLFSNKELAPAVSQESLVKLFEELASRLLDPALQTLDCGQQLSKALNVAMVKVLDNSDRNETYSALISIMEKSANNLRDLPDSQANDQTKFTELIMKCLWKLAKTVQDNLKTGVLKPNQLLRDLNNFFLATPPAEWKRRAVEKVPLGEVPLRTVKTLLLELVTGLGDGVYDHLDLIEDPQRSYVYPYLHHMLEAYRKKERQQTMAAIPSSTNDMSSRPSSISSIRSVSSITSDSAYAGIDLVRAQEINLRNLSMTEISSQHKDIRANGSQSSSPSPTFTRMNAQGSPIPDISPSFNETQSNSSEPVSPPSPRTPISARFPTPGDSSPRTSGSHEMDINSRLTQIFTKIGKKEETKQGIYELYEFQKKNPEMEARITAQLSKTGTHFQSYIKRGLQNIAVEEEEKQRANTIAEAKSMFPSESENVANAQDDAHKQKLLRLQQMFGYRSETIDRRLRNANDS